MFGSTQAVRRFSLLLLEEGELYVEDFVATARWPPGVAGNWQRLPRLAGQLRLCTKSLFFEPDDARVPIVRLPFQFIEGLEGSGDRRLLVSATRVIKMRANAADAPYIVERAGRGAAQHPEPLLWEFELSYARLEAVMPRAQQMLLASRLPPAEQEEFLQVGENGKLATLAATEAGARFDLGALRSASERIQLEVPAVLLGEGALVREPGRLLITDQRIYFQPLHNIGGDAVVSSHPLAAVAAAARRRSALRDLALEVFFADSSQMEHQHLAIAPHWGGTSALFAFASREERENAVAVLTAQQEVGVALPGGREGTKAFTAILEADSTWLSRVTAAWQRGVLSNFHYLLFLNLASGRSFADLSQYPVFPWILADYASPSLNLSDPAIFRDLSKPVGALNPVRLAMLRERYADMAGFSPEPAFLYGSHYSTPGFTMFWLVRAAPAHMLRLQAGRFDAPDRLFCSVADAWEGCTSTNPSDVKELIPEFFARHDFLLNLRGLALGTRQSGRNVGDVALPPWAASAPHFRAVLAAALEAPFVSANLHHWIDLIFGYKQRGEAAVAADNVFRHTAYEGAVDIEAVADPVERLALETQIAEFGQCPGQLFKHPHPQRLVCPPVEMPGPEAAGLQPSTGSIGAGSGEVLALVSTILSAATPGTGDSLRLEVPTLLAALDVLAWQRQQAVEAAMAMPKVPAHPSSHTDGKGGSGTSSEHGQAEAADDSPSKQAGAAAGRRLKLLGAWAAERKQAVSERLAGSVDAVRGAAAAALNAASDSGGGASNSAGSASRLQSLFNRKGSAAVFEPGEEVGPAAQAGSSPAAGLPPARPRSPPKSPAGRPAANLVGSISDRLSSFTFKGRPSGSASPALPAAARDTATAAGSADGGLQLDNLPAAESAEGSRSPTSGGPLWKFSRRASQSGALPPAPPADSSEDEQEAGAPRRQEGQQSVQLVPAASGSTVLGSPGKGTAGLPATQPQHMLGGSSGHVAVPVASSSGCGPGRPVGWYGAGLRDRLVHARTLAAGSESVNGCALAVVGGVQHAYSASHSGQLRVHQLASGEQVRAANLSQQPLTSIALLPAGGSSLGQQHPLALCGSFDACVHAYSPDFGRSLGSWQAAADAVACLQVTGGGSSDSRGGVASWVVAASWDGSIKGWDLGEGRQPWSSSACPPAASVQAPSGVWALAVAADGGVVLAGTEDGLVASWDLRCPSHSLAWSHQLLAGDYIGGLELCQGAPAVVVGAADGSLSLLDLRRAGAVLAAVSPSGLPLRCVASDGALALAGDEGGTLHLWNVGQQLGCAPAPAAGAWTPPRPDGLLAPLAADPPSPINALAAAPACGGSAGGLDVVIGHEDGLLRWYSTLA